MATQQPHAKRLGLAETELIAPLAKEKQSQKEGKDGRKRSAPSFMSRMYTYLVCVESAQCTRKEAVCSTLACLSRRHCGLVPCRSPLNKVQSVIDMKLPHQSIGKLIRWLYYQSFAC